MPCLSSSKTEMKQFDVFAEGLVGVFAMLDSDGDLIPGEYASEKLPEVPVHRFQHVPTGREAFHMNCEGHVYYDGSASVRCATSIPPQHAHTHAHTHTRTHAQSDTH